MTKRESSPSPSTPNALPLERCHRPPHLQSCQRSSSWPPQLLKFVPPVPCPPQEPPVLPSPGCSPRFDPTPLPQSGPPHSAPVVPSPNSPLADPVPSRLRPPVTELITAAGRGVASPPTAPTRAVASVAAAHLQSCPVIAAATAAPKLTQPLPSRDAPTAVADAYASDSSDDFYCVHCGSDIAGIMGAQCAASPPPPPPPSATRPNDEESEDSSSDGYSEEEIQAPPMPPPPPPPRTATIQLSRAPTRRPPGRGARARRDARRAHLR